MKTKMCRVNKERGFQALGTGQSRLAPILTPLHTDPNTDPEVYAQQQSSAITPAVSMMPNTDLLEGSQLSGSLEDFKWPGETEKHMSAAGASGGAPNVNALGYFDGYVDDEATFVTNMTTAYTDDTLTIKGGRGGKDHRQASVRLEMISLEGIPRLVKHVTATVRFNGYPVGRSVTLKVDTFCRSGQEFGLFIPL